MKLNRTPDPTIDVALEVGRKESRTEEALDPALDGACEGALEVEDALEAEGALEVEGALLGPLEPARERRSWSSPHRWLMYRLDILQTEGMLEGIKLLQDKYLHIYLRFSALFTFLSSRQDIFLRRPINGAQSCYISCPCHTAMPMSPLLVSISVSVSRPFLANLRQETSHKA